jgi:SAM-dependent methyltransferase
MNDDAPAKRIDTAKAHPSRVYDVFLGGKDHYPVDREAAKAGFVAHPRGYLDIRHNRDLLRRAIGFLAGEAGIRQFLDIGTGLPTQRNVHQIAQGIIPDARIVYVDNDPVVLAHARALLTSGPEGKTDYIDADLCDPATILEQAEKTLDFSRPIALVLLAVLHFVEDEQAYTAVRRLVSALPSGSYVLLSHLTADLSAGSIEVARSLKERGLTFILRSREEIERFVTENELELVEPGIVQVHRWRPDHVSDISAAERPSQEYIDGLEDLDKTLYQDIRDVTDEDINIYGLLAYKP